MGLFYSKKGGPTVGKSIKKYTASGEVKKKLIKNDHGSVVGWVKDGVVFDTFGKEKGRVSKNEYGGKINIYKSGRSAPVGSIRHNSARYGGVEVLRKSRESNDKEALGAAALLMGKDLKAKQSESLKSKDKTPAPSQGKFESKVRSKLDSMIFGHKDKKDINPVIGQSKLDSERPNTAAPRGFYNN